jgi:hypothetical protein
MWHSSQVKSRHGKDCAKCGGSISSFIGSLHLGQRKGEFLALRMPVAAVAIHRIYEVGCGSLFTLSAINVVSCIAP